MRLTGPIRRRDVRILTGANAGLRINAAHSQLGAALGTTEPELQRRLSGLLKNGDVFFDIGANIGFFSMIAARQVGTDGAVYAFDPVPEHVAAMRHNLAINSISHVSLSAVAVSDRNGTQTLFVPAESTGARLASIADGNAGHRRLDVEVATIDTMVERGALRPPDVVKIDVEGAEVEVLAGMRRTLEQYSPIVLCEMHGRNAEYVRAIRSAGYLVEALGGGDAEDVPAYAVYLEARRA
jgi:FkbM family methyltransferase